MLISTRFERLTRLDAKGGEYHMSIRERYGSRRPYGYWILWVLNEEGGSRGNRSRGPSERSISVCTQR